MSSWAFQPLVPASAQLQGAAVSTGQIKVWDGSWVAKPIKVWNGSSWEIKPLKFWNGASWELTGY